MNIRLKSTLCIGLILLLQACMPRIYPAKEAIMSAHLFDDYFIAPDGSHLPYQTWVPENQIEAVIIALHGFNDYNNFFQGPGSYLKNHGIQSYAFDQRGFGGSPNKGSWAGTDTLVSDLLVFVELIKNRHPGLPLFVLGESMGGAVVISALADNPDLVVDGSILVAPAVWSRDFMPWYQTAVLWTLAHTIPGKTLSGKNIKRIPSDNRDMLKALFEDPMTIKETRIESVYGLSNLMDKAFASAEDLNGKFFLLYGEKDEIIPNEPAKAFIKKLNPGSRPDQRIATYADSYHLILRDLGAERLLKDIAFWIKYPEQVLPSAADKRILEFIQNN